MNPDRVYVPHSEERKLALCVGQPARLEIHCYDGITGLYAESFLSQNKARKALKISSWAVNKHLGNGLPRICTVNGIKKTYIFSLKKVTCITD